MDVVPLEEDMPDLPVPDNWPLLYTTMASSLASAMPEQAQVFGSTGPVFRVNEESISAVSPQNFRGKGKSLFEVCCSGNHDFTSFLSIDVGDPEPGYYSL
ncbi:hypothetical protein PBY51_017969 [Eleginops maclovinus]|uniref:Uncharacterized protein n=1 Tax=Eleginops maclovinus TaxID=56733 RepID=A0AAN7XL89_ELEMC|nr:hypothetical protein PBY51_017969 [Eleginops maclovinus]